LKPRFILSLAVREARGSQRRGLLIVAAIAIGVAALVAINSFTDNLRESVAREARALLGADLTLSAAGPFSEKAESLLGDVRRATRPEAEVARVVSFGAMVPPARRRGDAPRAGARGRPRVPVLRDDRDGAGRRVGRGSRRAAARSPSPRCLTMLGAAVGDDIAIGDGALRGARHDRERAGDVGVRSAFGPRVYVPAPAARRPAC
jgi:putative ABC transport system permease protein